MSFFSNYLNIALIAIAVVSGVMLAWPTIMRRGHGVSAADATQMINRRNAVVVDLRSTDEFSKGHLPQARSVPFETLSEKAAQVSKNKSAPVLLVCQTGQRARKAEQVLTEAGYAEVYTLQGGIEAWQTAGMPVVK
ncbi:rhodanese-like domain-containing protein [Pararobbsia silviterrae]|uniref:Rhodanese-like domain-containing protein n=1 Tax=Pararobbsia silviterrae TaxID=1792498 RepID=A0A494YAL9_9BURK|nr:rhodanese-like domain-containing protein [Pararobbsia silviterrae]RKP58790.1 rhodanese-like domain-containing protein [Pararobbsia silviterrae]